MLKSAGKRPRTAREEDLEQKKFILTLFQIWRFGMACKKATRFQDGLIFLVQRKKFDFKSHFLLVHYCPPLVWPIFNICGLMTIGGVVIPYEFVPLNMNVFDFRGLLLVALHSNNAVVHKKVVSRPATPSYPEQ